MEDNVCRDKHCLSAFAKQTIADRRSCGGTVFQENLPPANCIRSECRAVNDRPYDRNGGTGDPSPPAGRKTRPLRRDGGPVPYGGTGDPSPTAGNGGLTP